MTRGSEIYNISDALSVVARRAGEGHCIDTQPERRAALKEIPAARDVPANVRAAVVETRRMLADALLNPNVSEYRRLQVNSMFSQCRRWDDCKTPLIPLAVNEAAGVMVFTNRVEWKSISHALWDSSVSSLKQSAATAKQSYDELGQFFSLMTHAVSNKDAARLVRGKFREAAESEYGPRLSAIGRVVRQLDNATAPSGDVLGVLGNLMVFSEGQQDCSADAKGVVQILQLLKSNGLLPNFEIDGVVAARRRGHLAVQITHRSTGKQFIADPWLSGTLQIMSVSAWNDATESAIVGMLGKQ